MIQTGYVYGCHCPISKRVGQHAPQFGWIQDMKCLIGASAENEKAEQCVLLPKHGRSMCGMMLYYTAFALYSALSLLKLSTFTNVFFISVNLIDGVVTLFVLALLAGKLLTQNARMSSWVLALLLITVGFISWRMSSEGWLFWTFLFVVCGDGAEIRKLATVAFVVSLVMVILLAMCALTGLTENVVKFRSVDGGRPRYSLGFVHPNSFGGALLIIGTSFSVMRFGERPLLSIAVLLGTGLTSITIADSRTPALVAFMQIPLLLVFRGMHDERKRKLFRRLFISIILLAPMMSLYFMVFYDANNPVHSVLDTLLNGRLDLAHQYFELAPITLFGNDYSSYPVIFFGTDGSTSQFVVDNAFSHIVLRFGFAAAALFIMGYTFLAIALYRQKRWDALLYGLIIMSLYSIEETSGAMIGYNYFLVAIASLLIYPTPGSGLRSSVKK